MHQKAFIVPRTMDLTMRIRRPKCGHEFALADQKKQIIRVVLQHEPLRFNELQRRTKISKPYLLDLLRRMQRNHEVVREVISKQNVRYSAIR